jgi:hypothetical protein
LYRGRGAAQQRDIASHQFDRAKSAAGVPVRLSRDGRRTLSSGLQADGGVLSVEKGHFGSKTTFKVVRLEASSQ